MKNDRERTPIYCKVNPLGLSPSSAFDAELLDDYPKGSEVEITIRRKRSPSPAPSLLEDFARDRAGY
jgi:hypothetical protein